MKRNPSSKIQEGLIGEIKSRRERLNGALYDHDTEKTRTTIVRRQQNELLLAKARDEVILKPLVEAQATFVAVTLRQMIPAFPLKALGRWSDFPTRRRPNGSWTRLHTNSARNSPISITNPNWLQETEARGVPHNPRALKSSGRVAEIYGVISKRASA
jgi:hypothetical protein